MIEPNYHFCPQCASPLHVEKHGDMQVQVCTQGHPLYKNQCVTTSGVVIRDEKMLMVRRAIEPQKGWLDLFGGYVEADEKPTAGMMRETKEELGVGCRVIRLLGAYGPDTYPYKGIVSYNLALIYLVELNEGEIRPQDDVASIEWIPLSQLPQGQMAFTSQNDFLADVASGLVNLRA